MNPVLYDPAAAIQASMFTDPNKSEEQFRDYHAGVRPEVRELYRLNHINQTFDFVRQQKQKYTPLNHTRMGVWEAMEQLNQIIDDSDPDTDLPQIEHAMQTAEQIRRDGHPRWFVLAGLIHDLGKVLCLFDEPQWAVVGDTFPVGCAFSEQIVFPEFFAENPDSLHPVYSTRFGIYEEGCGLDNVHLSWGHDEYLYHVVKDYLPEEALAIIRYHSCYPIHREGAYDYLLNAKDRKGLEWVKKFNPYDLYTKSHEKPDFAKLRPFYEELVAEFFPRELRW
jgi:inositol oxygenase